MAKPITKDLEIVELKIQMHTNMDTQVELTADRIGNKKVNGKYPLLCTNCRYSEDILKHKLLNERFDIFFIRTKFYNFILASKLKKNQTITQKYDKDIVKHNITVMLNALFQISFPIQDQVVLKDEPSINLENMIKQIFKPNQYTYLNLNKLSTVTQVIWLNTTASNPIYYEIYKKSTIYYKRICEYASSFSSNTTIQGILSNPDTDMDKIKEIRRILPIRNIYTIDPATNKINKIALLKEDWILHFLVSNYRKNTKDYNDFIKIYVKTFINSDSDNYRYSNYNSQEQYEKQFYQSVPEIKFYQKYMTDIAELLPPKRISMDGNIATALKFAKETNDFSSFISIYTDKGKNILFPDIIRVDDGKYEIHLGVAVVGGKVTQTNSKFLCNYNSHKSGSDLNYLIKDVKDGEDDNEKIRLYGYIDLENVKDTTEYIGVINSKLKKKNDENENNPKKRGGKTRKRGHRNNKTRRLVSVKYFSKETY